MKYFQFILYSLLSIHYIQAQSESPQIVMSKRMQYSQLASSDDKQLFLIDFWATWCAPCITVSEYLNVVQAKYAKELYVLSLSEENPEIVEKFLKRHKTKLAVSLDYDNQNFKQYNIRALPSGVLLNAEGKIIWRGNPADLKDRQIDQFLRQNQRKVPIYNFLQYKSYETETIQSIEIEGDYKLNEITYNPQTLPIVEQLNDQLTSVKGSLQQVLAYLLNTGQQQVQVRKPLNQSYQLIINQQADKNEIVSAIKKQLGLKSEETQKTDEILEVTLVSYDLLWDKKQINWGIPNAKFLVDDNQITADNMSIREILALISELHNIPIQLMNQNQYINSYPYDWQVHYRFKDLLISNLNDYGFKTNLQKGSFPIYIFN